MLGPIVSIPWGLVLYILICAAIMIIIAEICWRVMDHLPEDDEVAEEGKRFVLQRDDD